MQYFVRYPLADRGRKRPNMLSKIVLVSDHSCSACALRQTVGCMLPAVRLVHIPTILHAVGMIASGRDVDLVLVDYWLPQIYPPHDVNELCRLWPHLPVVVVSAFGQPAGGLEGFRRSVLYAEKSLDGHSLSIALRSVLPGQVLHCPPGPDVSEREEIARLKRRLCTLTDQQFRVLGMLCRGLLNKQIAHELSVEETTVKAHNRDIFRKLRVRSRVEASLKVAELNLGSVLCVREPSEVSAG